MKIILHKSVLFVPLFLILVFCSTTAVHADTPTPSITAFSATPSAIGNNYTVALTWTNQDATGAAINFTCPNGVTITKSTGGSFPCNTTQTVSQVSNASDSAAFIITNIGGTTATLTATVYPLDANGQVYTGNPSTTNITVTTSPYPIISFSIASTTLMSGGQQTFTWTGVDTTGTYLQLGCVDNVHYFTSGQATELPCNTRSLSTDLPTSGSQAITIVSNSLFPSTIPAIIVPSSGSGTYDMTHSKSTSFIVSGMIVVPDPSTTSFSTPTPIVTSSATTSLSWTTANASGANIQLSCTGNIVATTLNSSSTVITLPCNTPIFDTALTPTGTTTITFTNTTPSVQVVPITLLPASTSGAYFGINAKTINLQVLPPGVSLPPVAPVTVLATSTTSLPSVTTSPAAVTTTTKQIPTYTFTKALKRGSSNADVKALQTLLARNTALYPEQAVSGYFGAATLRALERFQVKYNIAKPGGAGYGSVGPKTRAVLNSLTTI